MLQTCFVLIASGALRQLPCLNIRPVLTMRRTFAVAYTAIHVTGMVQCLTRCRIPRTVHMSTT